MPLAFALSHLFLYFLSVGRTRWVDCCLSKSFKPISEGAEEVAAEQKV
jgi:hypothetical protein